MNRVEQFLIYCSGADRDILEECPTDKNKYIGIGGTVFFTGVLAFVSSSYAILTVFDNYLTALFFGLVWGLMIFNLDRYIVSSMKSRGSWFRDLAVAFPRLVMAILLALVISKPLELKIFEKEINAELLVMEQEVFKTQEDRVKARFTDQITEHESRIEELQAQIDAKAAARDTLAMMALQEADGTGGSGKKNLGPIYRAKKEDADKAAVEYENTRLQLMPLIAESREAIQKLENEWKAETQALARTAFDGPAARIDALQRLGQGSDAIWWANLFIMLLFIAVETAPIFVKLISSRSPYDFRLHQQEFEFQMAHLRETSLLNNRTKNLIQFDTETSVHRTRTEIEAEKELTDHYIDQRKEELKTFPVDWEPPLIRSQTR